MAKTSTLKRKLMSVVVLKKKNKKKKHLLCLQIWKSRPQLTKMKKCKRYQACLLKELPLEACLFPWAGSHNDLIINWREAWNIICNAMFLHVALVVIEEHVIHLLMIVCLQNFLLRCKPCLESCNSCLNQVAYSPAFSFLVAIVVFSSANWLLLKKCVDPHFSRASPLDRRDSLFFICEKIYFSFEKKLEPPLILFLF